MKSIIRTGLDETVDSKSVDNSWDWHRVQQGRKKLVALHWSFQTGMAALSEEDVQ